MFMNHRLAVVAIASQTTVATFRKRKAPLLLEILTADDADLEIVLTPQASSTITRVRQYLTKVFSGELQQQHWPWHQSRFCEGIMFLLFAYNCRLHQMLLLHHLLLPLFHHLKWMRFR